MHNSSNSSLDQNSSLTQWLHHLEDLHPQAIDMGLERVEKVLAQLELTPSNAIKIIVGGTNGKGSTCTMLESILLAAGYKVGLYTSPHLVYYNERIRLNGENASDELIVRQFALIDQKRAEISLSYFEFSTLAALTAFHEAKVDIMLFEVGLGGRLDAVNIIDADCSIITNVDIDHIDYLGNDREHIAWEKARIFRPNKPAICSDPLPPAAIKAYADEIGADLWQFGVDFNYSGDAQQWAFAGRTQRRAALAYPALRGVNQLLNASAVLAALEALRLQLLVSANAVREGLARATIPGRMQILPGQPFVVLDVAHNPHAAGALAQNLQQMPMTPNSKTFAVVGMFQDKEVAAVISRLLPYVDTWLCATLEGPRALSSQVLSDIVKTALSESELSDNEGEVTAAPPTVRPQNVLVNKEQVQTLVFDDVVQAFVKAQDLARDNDRILVFGSFFTVGPILSYLDRL